MPSAGSVRKVTARTRKQHQNSFVDSTRRVATGFRVFRERPAVALVRLLPDPVACDRVAGAEALIGEVTMGQLFRWIVSAAIIGFVVTALHEYLHTAQVLSSIGQQWGQP